MEHACSESGRFERLENSLEGINESLSKLTSLLISSATTGVRLEKLEIIAPDIELRVRSLEKTANRNVWIERLAWAIVVGVVVSYFKFN